MKQITIPFITAGLLLLAACSPVAATLPPGRFTPPDWIKGTWRFDTSGAGNPPKELRFTATNIFIQPATSGATGGLQDLSTTWQDLKIKEVKDRTAYSVEGFDRQGIRIRIDFKFTAAAGPHLNFASEAYDGFPRASISRVNGTYVRK